MHDVVVVGGGPGGLYAAQLLARRGVDVVLFEEHPTSGDPVHCTGVLASEAFDEFDLPRDALLNPLRTVRFHPPDGPPIDYTTPGIEAVVIDRLVFDRQLHADAARAGVSIFTGQRVTDVAIGRDGVRVALADGQAVTSRACILACGASYVMQRRLGLGLPGLFLQSAQLELPARTPGPVEVHFGRSVAPLGFAWAVPVRRPGGAHARIGLMCQDAAADRFRAFAATAAPRWGLAIDDLRPRLKMLPLAPIARTFTDRLIAIGDAAGIVKATTGGGIYYSMVSAGIAAGVLTSCLRRERLDAMSLSAYEDQWRERLGAELDAQRRLRDVAHELDDTDIDALFELARTDGIMPIVRQTARFNQHRGLILALFRHQPARRVLLQRLRAPAILHALD